MPTLRELADLFFRRGLSRGERIRYRDEHERLPHAAPGTPLAKSYRRFPTSTNLTVRQILDAHTADHPYDPIEPHEPGTK